MNQKIKLYNGASYFIKSLLITIIFLNPAKNMSSHYIEP